MQFASLPKLFSFGGLTTLAQMQANCIAESFLPCLSLGGVRYKRGKYQNKVAKEIWPGGEEHHGFTYYPRHPDQKDPPYEPSQMFMVTRVKGLRGKPYWEKYIMERHLRIVKAGDVAIVKNTPTMNAMLYRVKHLIEMKPITFPYGKPKDLKDGYLDDHGRFITYNLLPSNLEKSEEEAKQLKEKSVDGATLKRRLQYKWLQRWE